MEKLYRIRCHTGYAILGEKPPQMDSKSLYRVLCKSEYYQHCFVVERYDRKMYRGHKTWIVHEDALWLEPQIIQ